jgi:hypothetical protein
MWKHWLAHNTKTNSLHMQLHNLMLVHTAHQKREMSCDIFGCICWWFHRPCNCSIGRTVECRQKGLFIPFTEFKSVLCKTWHAFITVLTGLEMLSPFNAILSKCPAVLALSRNKILKEALNANTLHWAGQCMAGLGQGCNATGCGIGGIIVGEINHSSQWSYKSKAWGY